MALSIDHEVTERAEDTGLPEQDETRLPNEMTLRDEVRDNPVVQRVLRRIQAGGDQTPTAHQKHSSHSTHSTHSAGWLEPKR